MRFLLIALSAALFLSACGKKAPLRAPDDRPEESQLLTANDETYS